MRVSRRATPPRGNGLERRKDVLRLTAKVGRKPSLGVGRDDSGDEDLVADPDCRRILISFRGRLKRGRYDGREQRFGIGFLLSGEVLLRLDGNVDSAYGNMCYRSLDPEPDPATWRASLPLVTCK